MICFFKPLPPSNMDFSVAKPFIKNEWFSKHFMIFAYALQLLLVFLSVRFKVWLLMEWYIQIPVLIAVFLIHELLHIVVIYKIGDIRVSFSKGFFWITSNAVMSKIRFWLFMSLPLLALTVIPIALLPMLKGSLKDMVICIAWFNAIVAGADIINSVLILFKPSHAKFCRGYYIV